MSLLARARMRDPGAGYAADFVTGVMARNKIRSSGGMLQGDGLALGGLIVGVGVTFGSGCTSGHGVCGMARLSPRSIAATAVFMATTFATVYVMRHMIGA